jgi:nucleoside-diphosphate-sugar epimerase
MPIWGDGSQGVDLIHTSQLAKCFVYLVEQHRLNTPQLANGRQIEGGSGIAMTVLEVAHWVAEFAGVRPLVEFLPMRRGERPTQIVARNPLIAPSHALLMEQLQETVQWYLDQ